MPWVTSSENGCRTNWIPLRNSLWRCGVVRTDIYNLNKSLSNYCWNTLTVEGDSPIDLGFMVISVSWVAFIGNWAWIKLWEASTSNSKHYLRPIAYLVPRGKAEKNPFSRGWKVPETRWRQPGMAWKEWWFITILYGDTKNLLFLTIVVSFVLKHEPGSL